MSLTHTSARQPLDLFIDQVTQSVERTELRAGIVHDRDRELLSGIGLCECTYCLTNPPEPCQEEPDVVTLTEDGVQVLCARCQEDHNDGSGQMLVGMTDAELSEWGRVR